MCGDNYPSQRKFDNENDVKTKILIALLTHKAIFSGSLKGKMYETNSNKRHRF